jgi:hypothetical protein
MEQIKNFYGSIQIMVLVPQLQSTSSTQFIGANFSATPHAEKGAIMMKSCFLEHM